jgi:hypothetical protein|tara:strand:- start:58 stop:1053 length:996 start_codon:yes stop_codon:yes gene_type:complete
MSLQQMLAAASAGGGISASDVFSADTYTGNQGSQTITNNIDLSGEGGLVWIKSRDTLGTDHVLQDTVRGTSKYLQANSSVPPSDISTGITSFNSNGFTVSSFYSVNGSSLSMVAWTFRKAEKFFDIITWTGNGTSNRALSHNLGVVPEFIITKRTSANENWQITFDDLISNAEGFKEGWRQGDKNTNVSAWGGSTPVDAPTATTLSVGSNSSINGNNDTYVGYLFASLAGVSKVGTYTGSTGNVDVDCGFTSGAAFVMIKSTGNHHWYIWDSTRGINSGNEPFLWPGLTNAEQGSNDFIDPINSGFRVTNNESNGAVNSNGATFYFFAIAA